VSLKDKTKEALNDEVEYDFSGAREGGDFGPIEVGPYEAVVETAEPHVSKAGNNTAKFMFKIVEGEKNAGRVFFRHCPLTGAGSGIFRDTAAALGADLTKGKKVSLGQFVGVHAIITIAYQKGSTDQQEIKRVTAVAAKRVSPSKTSATSPAAKAAAAKTATKAAPAAPRAARSRLR
jgi:hypothetical protein